MPIIYNRDMASSNNNNERKNTMTHINSIFSTMDGGYDAEIDRTGAAYRIIIQHLGETYLHYSSTEDGCYDYLYSIVR